MQISQELREWIEYRARREAQRMVAAYMAKVYAIADTPPHTKPSDPNCSCETCRAYYHAD